ncbi:hypothetical protein A8709_09735 [Paenibacillus pectinilyticus]|uniref:Uncharacterized protein n=1 Tax=Paenibacillus pectinilyticus TaxID=512399 RepID=A0A1C1A5R6_9BACL|nr:hypothetical protein [Paenibacillus pectinilyticus]OCT15895.1 hypothetical protein A8709_09735 [Paenibacillus pectinilyticus]
MSMYRKKRAFYIIGSLLAGVILLYGIVYMNDKPGGIADWRLSRAMGMQETIRTPLGETPEEAISKFRHQPARQVIHREPVEGGMLLFTQQPQATGSNLQAEYAHKVWLGWKWAGGGGYSIGASQTSQPSDTPKTALDFMIFPSVKKPSMPFTLVFGRVQDAAVADIRVQTHGAEAGNYIADLVTIDAEHTIWLVRLPWGTKVPFELEARNDKGVLLAHQTLRDQQGAGSVNLGE